MLKFKDLKIGDCFTFNNGTSAIFMRIAPMPKNQFCNTLLISPYLTCLPTQERNTCDDTDVKFISNFKYNFGQNIVFANTSKVPVGVWFFNGFYDGLYLRTNTGNVYYLDNLSHNSVEATIFRGSCMTIGDKFLNAWGGTIETWDWSVYEIDKIGDIY